MVSQQLLDEFAMITRRGAENASLTLSKWLHRSVRIEVSSVDLVRLDLIPEEPEESAGTTVTLASRVKGELPGNTAVQLSYDDASQLVACLGGTMTEAGRGGEIGEMERSMLQETANILFSSLMNSLASHLGLRAIPHAPAVLVGIGTAAWGDLLLEAAEESDEAVVVTARLACIGSGPRLRLVFLPAPAACAVIRKGIDDDQR